MKGRAGLRVKVPMEGERKQSIAAAVVVFVGSLLGIGAIGILLVAMQRGGLL